MRAIDAIRSIRTEGLGLSQASLDLVAALRAAVGISWSWQRQEGGGEERVPADGAEVDAAFQAIDATIQGLPDSEDRATALRDLGHLYSRAYAHNARLDEEVSVQDLRRALHAAQFSACWAAGDADKV